MKYSSLIDNVTSLKWGLNIQLAYLFDWIYSLPSWADSVIIENHTYYFASKTKAIEELALLTNKIDTMYRHYKSLEDLGLILVKKVDGKDYIALTEKAKDWNHKSGKISELPEKLPRKSGKKSGKQPEKNPTYKITISDKIIKDTTDSTSLFKDEPKPEKEKVVFPFNTITFINKWDEWLQYRKEIKKPYKSIKSQQAQLKELGKYPEAVAIASIDKTIASGWVGLFPEKIGDQQKPEAYRGQTRGEFVA